MYGMSRPVTVGARWGEPIELDSLVCREQIACLMLELVNLRAWSQQVAAMLAGVVPAGTLPWPCFKDEYKT
jgi:hypothetical protein